MVGGKSFDNAKDACKYAKEILADYGFTMFKDNGETWEDVFEAELFQLERERLYECYTFTIIVMVSMYLAYLWGRWLTRGEIAAELQRIL